jgi:ketosteroid isomerase-like protein
MTMRWVGLLLVLSSGKAFAQVEDSVKAVEMNRRQALLAADTVALSRMLAPDFIEISRLGTVRTRADNIRDIASGALHLTSVTYDSLTVRVYGDVAVLTGIADNTGTMRGFPFSGKIRYTRVFVRRDGRWQAVLMQQTPIQ